MIHPEPTGAGLERSLRFFLNFRQKVSIFASSDRKQQIIPINMAKELQFKLNGKDFAAAPVKLERKKIYGWKSTNWTSVCSK
jgi:hypothetical protein